MPSRHDRRGRATTDDSRIRKKQRIRTGDDDTPLGELDLGRPTG